MKIHNPEVFNIADHFINLANDLGKDLPSSRISAALLYAAARYNVFSCSQEHSFGKKRKDIRRYLVNQCSKMLDDNLDDLISPELSPPNLGDDN